MADDIIQNTLSGTLTGTTMPATPSGLQAPTLSLTDNQANIANLSKAQQTPQALMDLQKAMQLTTSTAYKERQAGEMQQASQQFDPTKVSGGTFAGIIGNLEQRRGMDIGKIYQSTMSTYVKVQDAIRENLQFLQQLEESKRQFTEQLKLDKKYYKLAKKESKQKAKLMKKQMEMDEKTFNLNYSQALKRANQNLGLAFVDGWKSFKENFGGTIQEGDTYSSGGGTYTFTPEGKWKPIS